MNWHKRRSLQFRILLPTIMLILVALFSLTWYAHGKSREAIINSTMISAVETIDQFKILRGYYTNNVIAKVKKSSSLKVHFEHKNDPETIPLPATMIHDLSQILAKKSGGLQLRLYSEFPFPNRQTRVLDAFARDAISQLKKDKSDAPRFIRIERVNDQETVRVAIPDRMVAQACVNCHNSHPLTPKNNWKLGDMRGILEVTASIDQQLKVQAKLTQNIVWFTLLLTLVAAIVILFLVRPIHLFARKLQASTQSLWMLADYLKDSSMDISASTSQQTSSTQVSSAAIEKISIMVSRTTEFANQSSHMAQTAKEEASQGNQSIQQMESAMKSIESGYSELQQMEEVIQEISQKTSIINDIVFKTQLLAVNASIEAARAGDHGKGFAVVAEEVGKLAQTSGQAAEEIRRLLDRSETQVGHLVGSTQSRLSEGQQTTEKAVKVFAKIASEISDISERVQQIEQASQEQSEGVTQTQLAMAQLDEVAAKQAMVAEHIVSFAQELDQVAYEIRLLSNDVLGNVESENRHSKGSGKRSTSLLPEKNLLPPDNHEGTEVISS